MQWQVRPVVPVLEAVAALLVVTAALLLDRADKPGLVLGLAAGVLLATLATRDAVARTRLIVDEHGLTVLAGFAGRRLLPWGQVEAIRLEERQRLGVRSRLLEIDAGDQLVLLSTRDLGTDPGDVVDTLVTLRPAALAGQHPRPDDRADDDEGEHERHP